MLFSTIYYKVPIAAAQHTQLKLNTHNHNQHSFEEYIASNPLIAINSGKVTIATDGPCDGAPELMTLYRTEQTVCNNAAAVTRSSYLIAPGI
eukprot:7154021-Ditylum_brightwellii.AAC.1